MTEQASSQALTNYLEVIAREKQEDKERNKLEQAKRESIRSAGERANDIVQTYAVGKPDLISSSVYNMEVIPERQLELADGAKHNVVMSIEEYWPGTSHPFIITLYSKPVESTEGGVNVHYRRLFQFHGNTRIQDHLSVPSFALRGWDNRDISPDVAAFADQIVADYRSALDADPPEWVVALKRVPRPSATS